MNLTNEQTVALSKVIKDKAFKAASAALDATTYTVDFLVRVRGSFVKGEDIPERLQPNKIKWILLFAILASKVNKETLASVIREYVKAVTSGDYKAQEEEIKDHVQSTVDELKGLHKVSVAGSIRSTLLAEEVQVSVTPVAVSPQTDITLS